MRLSVWDDLIRSLGVKTYADESMKLVDLARHTSDPLKLAGNPIFRAMLEDRLNDETTTNSQHATIVSPDATV